MNDSKTTHGVRIGVDVGGTFTHAVALDASNNRLIGKTKVPTTHHAADGVGEGVVQSVEQLLKKLNVGVEQVRIVAHSTTQATNSLLEGDVDPVGIISLGRGIGGKIAKRAANLGTLPLAPGRGLVTTSVHFSLDELTPSQVEAELLTALALFRSKNIRVIVIGSPFSVDAPELENEIAEFCRAQGFLATPTHEVSQLYGLKIRLRTTAINASILPKMIEVADRTEARIRGLGIKAPFLIMRSDGGVMTIEEMRKKPILTLLSGPAAGIAAALRYLEITDGIFLEVGGTSTDISAIRNGRAVIRPATIGGNRTFLRTLDCRTLGIGGGSVPRGHAKNISDVGPRSAHIAGVKYAAFCIQDLRDPSGDDVNEIQLQPRDGDPSDYLAFEEKGSNLRFSFTPSCAANALGLVPDADPARATREFPGPMVRIAEHSGTTIEAMAERVLEHCSQKVGAVVKGLFRDYQIAPEWVTLVGGGGGAAAIVPHVAKTLGTNFQLAQDADVISAIGVALGMIREGVERSVVNPTPEDLFKIREEARARVFSQGASPESIEVFVEVDLKKNIVRAEAQGSIDFKKTQPEPSSSELSNERLELLARDALGLKASPKLIQTLSSKGLYADQVEAQVPIWLGLRRSLVQFAVIRDHRGVVRLRLKHATLYSSNAAQVVRLLTEKLPEHTTFDDGGSSYPLIHVLRGSRVIDLSKVHEPSHFQSLLELELKDVPEEEPCVLIMSQSSGEEEA
jgi:N-methylhydantoinase A